MFIDTKRYINVLYNSSRKICVSLYIVIVVGPFGLIIIVARFKV